MFGEDVEGEREIGSAERLCGNRTSGLRNRQVGLEFFRWIEGPQGRPGNMQGAEREGTGRVDLWPNFWTDSWDESKFLRRQRVASVGCDLMKMGSTWAPAKSVQREPGCSVRRVRDVRPEGGIDGEDQRNSRRPDSRGP